MVGKCFVFDRYDEVGGGRLVVRVVPMSLDHITYWQKNSKWSFAAMVLKEEKQKH